MSNFSGLRKSLKLFWNSTDFIVRIGRENDGHSLGLLREKDCYTFWWESGTRFFGVCRWEKVPMESRQYIRMGGALSAICHLVHITSRLKIHDTAIVKAQRPQTTTPWGANVVCSLSRNTGADKRRSIVYRQTQIWFPKSLDRLQVLFTRGRLQDPTVWNNSSYEQGCLLAVKNFKFVIGLLPPRSRQLGTSFRVRKTCLHPLWQRD